jgi:hypothetical protein
MSAEFPLYTGNCPRNVSRDAKYSVRSRGGEWVVEVLYETDEGERWHASTEDHEALVEIVNAVKVAEGGRPGGPFYINEYGQVIVPAGPDGLYRLAPEEYEPPLRFHFEGKILSGEGMNLLGEPLSSGDLWDGLHHGIPYTITADGSDIYYRVDVRPNVDRKISLSKHVSPGDLEALMARIRSVKGWQGGRLYINEWREMFVPRTEGPTVTYHYVDHLELDDPWFPKPR